MRASVVAASRLRSTGSAVVTRGLSCSVACGVFLSQGWNPFLLHWWADSLPLSHQGSPPNPPLPFLFFYFVLPSYVEIFLAPVGVWNFLLVFSRCSVRISPHVSVFLMYFVGEGKLHVLFLHHLDAIYSPSRFSKIFSYGQIDEASLLKKDHSLKNEIYLCYFLLIYLWYFTIAFYWLNLHLLILTYKIFFIIPFLLHFSPFVCQTNSFWKSPWSSMFMHIGVLCLTASHGKIHKDKSSVKGYLVSPEPCTVSGMLCWLNKWLRWSENNSSKTKHNHHSVTYSSNFHVSKKTA